MRKFEDRYIRESNNAKFKGFHVRFSRDLKIIASKFFSKKKYGTQKNARRVARIWRTIMEKKLGLDTTKPLEKYLYKNPPFQTRPARTNKSGVVGVFYHEFISKEGRKFCCWVAAWYPQKNKLKVKSFYIHIHGYDEAKRLAIEYRKEKQKELKKLALALRR